MRIINVIEIKDGVVDEITSFGIFEEQLSNEVVEQAEKQFIKKAKKYGFDGDEDEEYNIIEDGYYNYHNYSVNLVWSDV